VKTKKKGGSLAGSRYTIGTFGLQSTMTVVAGAFLLPVMIVLNYSFKSKKELYLNSPLALAQAPSWDNYKAAIDRLSMATTFLNTILYTVVSVAIMAVLSGAAAWAIARNKGRFFKFSYVYFIVGILLPYQALFLSIYIIGFTLHLTNTVYGVILMYVATGMSFGVFIMTSFIGTVPVELEESARLDGCSIYRIYWSIVMPLLKPAFATLVIMQAFQVWNDYLMASLFVSSAKLKTLTVAMQGLFSQQATDYTTAMGAIVMTVLPIAALFMALQKYFIKGMTVGAVKG
jgi:raffinose/stachyose/melibiose transport system permease protein